MFKKIKLLKSGQFSFSPSEKVSVFSEGDVIGLPEDKADLLISAAWAEVFKDVIKEETNKKDAEISKEKERDEEKFSTCVADKLFCKRNKKKR